MILVCMSSNCVVHSWHLFLFLLCWKNIQGMTDEPVFLSVSLKFVVKAQEDNSLFKPKGRRLF